MLDLINKWGEFIPISFAVLTVIAHVLIGFSLLGDARHQRTIQHGTWPVGPAGWFFLGLGGGFIALGMYWVIHYSSFRKKA